MLAAVGDAVSVTVLDTGNRCALHLSALRDDGTCPVCVPWPVAQDYYDALSDLLERHPVGLNRDPARESIGTRRIALCLDPWGCAARVARAEVV